MFTSVSSLLFASLLITQPIPPSQTQGPLLKEQWTADVKVGLKYYGKPFTYWSFDDEGIWFLDIRTGARTIHKPISEMAEGEMFPAIRSWNES